MTTDHHTPRSGGPLRQLSRACWLSLTLGLAAAAKTGWPQTRELARGGSAASVFSQPQAGDVFREYLWTNEHGDAGGALRVGGRLDYGGGPIPLDHAFDLAHATRAEAVIEKVLCHDGTRGLAISVNNHEWLDVPEAMGIAQPPWEYQHHICPVVAVPLAHLRAGRGNQFRLRVSDEHPWNWPQNLIYGVHVRIYYDPAKKPHPAGSIVSPRAGAALPPQAVLLAEASSPNGTIRQVDYLGHYEDVNLEGDGTYRQWHYRYVRARLTGHIGSAFSAPWRVAWDTSWVPDQSEPLRLAARITDETGLTCLTKPVEGLSLDRRNRSVELCKPYDVPRKWVTRLGEKGEKFRVRGDLRQAVAAQLVWSSWSPGHMQGIFINDQKVFEREGPRYACFVHRVTLADTSAFRQGENLLKTGATPKQDGKMVHGMEVNWPGIMVLIQYRQP